MKMSRTIEDDEEIDVKKVLKVGFFTIVGIVALVAITLTIKSFCHKVENQNLAIVQSFGGTSWDSHRIWLQAVIKYNLIQLGYWLFGKNLKFKIQHNAILKRLIPL